MYGLRVSTQSRGDSLVVTIDGDLDLVTCAQLDERLTQVRREHRHVVLDMSAVGFMDTSSLAVIVGHWKRLEAVGGALALAGAPYQRTKALWVTGLADRLPMYDTVEQAVSAQSGHRPAGTAAPADVTPGHNASGPRG